MVDRVDIQQVLQQIQMARLQQPLEKLPVVNANAPEVVPRPDFGALLKGALDKVQSFHSETGRLQNAYVKGDPSVTLSQVMIASQKSSVAGQAIKHLRNQLVEAFENIMKMPM